jgi:hypothetical protein
MFLSTNFTNVNEPLDVQQTVLRIWFVKHPSPNEGFVGHKVWPKITSPEFVILVTPKVVARIEF